MSKKIIKTDSFLNKHLIYALKANCFFQTFVSQLICCMIYFLFLTFDVGSIWMTFKKKKSIILYKMSYN